MELSESGKVIRGGLVGVVAGVILSIGMQNIRSPTQKGRLIEKENMPRIMKIDNHLTADQILVEDPDNAGDYISLEYYLERKYYDRNKVSSERARIEGAVSYEEKQ